MGKGTVEVPTAYEAAQEMTLALREAGLGGAGQYVTCGGLEDVEGRGRQLVLSCIPCGMSNHHMPVE